MHILWMILLFSHLTAATELDFTVDRAHYRLSFEKSRITLSSESGNRSLDVANCSTMAIEDFRSRVEKAITPPTNAATEIGNIPAAARIDVQMNKKKWHTTKGTNQGLFLLRLGTEFERLTFNVRKACR